MLTAGATWYPDEAKKWAVSALNRYEFNQEQDDTDITPGQAYTVEGGISYGVYQDDRCRRVGYYQQQVTRDTGPALCSESATAWRASARKSARSIPKHMLGVSLRYAYEFWPKTGCRATPSR